MAVAITRQALRLAIVGDVHDEWDTEIDGRALECLKPDLVLFTGDFGDENVDVVSDISQLNMSKAAILGNHDCWWSAGITAGKGPHRNVEYGDAVQAQLDFLGKSHVGYSRADFPSMGLSVVGGRPGSGGGGHIGSSSLAKKKWNIKNMKQSAERIIAQALEAPADHAIVFLAHNGPTGLGSDPSDICGKDWVLEGGDHGDPDLATALSQVKGAGKRNVSLVVFGHMHKHLQYNRGDRKMIVVGEDGSIYLNAAVVPRIRSPKAEGAKSEISSHESAIESLLGEVEAANWLNDEPNALPSERNFTVVDLVDGEPQKIEEVWVKVTESDVFLGEQTLLYSG
ncbi:unnamed protein product [Calypogeia fissa]